MLWYCPGCEHAHCIRAQTGAAPSPAWDISGTPEVPTFSPSVHCWHDKGKLVDDVWQSSGERVTTCHCFVREGGIQFLPDCAHALAGQTVPMPAWPDGYGGG